MDEILTSFVQYLREEDSSENTIQKYLTNLRQFAEWFRETYGTDFTPDAVTPLDLQDYRSFLDNVKRRKPSTINNVVATLKKFFSFAIEQGLTQSNPTRKLKTKRTSMQELAPKWHERREQSKLITFIESEIEEKQKKNISIRNPVRNLAMIHCMLSVGLRVEEVSDLKIADVDLEKGFLQIQSGKGNKFSILPINKTVMESIKNWLSFRLDSDTPDSAPLFTSQKNQSIAVRSIKSVVHKYAEKTNIEDLSCHTLRHSFGKNLIDQGYQISYVSKLMRHENIETTKRYTLPSQRELRKMVDSIEQ